MKGKDEHGLSQQHQQQHKNQKRFLTIQDSSGELRMEKKNKRQKKKIKEEKNWMLAKKEECMNMKIFMRRFLQAFQSAAV